MDGGEKIGWVDKKVDEIDWEIEEEVKGAGWETPRK